MFSVSRRRHRRRPRSNKIQSGDRIHPGLRYSRRWRDFPYGGGSSYARLSIANGGNVGDYWKAFARPHDSSHCKLSSTRISPVPFSSGSQYGVRLQNTYDAVAANEALLRGDDAAVKKLMAANSTLEYTTAKRRVVFDKVELLSTGNKPEAVRQADANALDPNLFTLDVDHPDTDPNGVVSIKVTFHAIDAKLDESNGSVTTTNEEVRRWTLLETYVDQPTTQWDYGERKGTVVFKVIMTNNEGANNRMVVRVGATYTASIWDKGKLNDVRTIVETVKIRLVIGPRDSRTKP